MNTIFKILSLLNKKYNEGNNNHCFSVNKYNRPTITVYFKDFKLYYYVDQADFNKSAEQFVEELSDMIDQDLELRKK